MIGPLRLTAGILIAAALSGTTAPVAAQVTGALTVDGAIAARGGRDLTSPLLRRSIVVESDIVRIGDLIENAGAFATIPVFRSPDVGTTGSVPARKVIEAARAHNMFGVDSGDIIDVQVTRSGRVISRQEIEARIARLFSGTNGLGDPRNLSISFDREAASFFADLPPDADLKAMRAVYDPRSNRFDVVFDVPVGISRRTLLRYTGSLMETANAVVPTRTIARGEVVRAGDIAIERRPKAEITGDITGSVDEAIGRAARQALRLGQPVRRADLMRPELIHREDSITLVYAVPGILLTTRGKALEAGSEGDVVNVLNIQTKRNIQGIVTGPGRVDIAASVLRTETIAANSPAESPAAGTE